ncbi:helix-turn-helix transcriptional regulator [Tahibacter amnicola]|uniref:YafY family transcriptional regulator n=1 Tax=Tahibacter amnicola TaxID=2976241 RepID=A0ABY6BJ29_9GAMM|nr:YafY family protein [Tahibacter amnicola]UXI68380.1 YafY family transcriptional regulator [Tahibacter amnicola]
MSHPASRVLAVLELLQAHGRLPGSELARRMGVDVRTLRRYIRTLEDIGIPVTAERGRYGAYSLVAGFKLPPLMFTDDEVLAVAVGLLAARGLGLADAAPAAASAQAKLERVMPPALRARVRAIDETVTLDIRGGDPVGGNNAALLQLSSSAQLQRRVELHYCSSAGDTTARDFDPYGLTWRSGRWYAVGYCHLRHGLRSFRLDRVLEVRPRPVSFGRPAGFDAAAYLALSIASLPRAIAVEVLLETDLAGAQREFFGNIGVFEAVEAGVLLRTRTDDLDWFACQLARLSFGFHVQSPDALREAIVTHAQRLLDRHGRAVAPAQPGDPSSHAPGDPSAPARIDGS